MYVCGIHISINHMTLCAEMYKDQGTDMHLVRRRGI